MDRRDFIKASTALAVVPVLPLQLPKQTGYVIRVFTGDKTNLKYGGDMEISGVGKQFEYSSNLGPSEYRRTPIIVLTTFENKILAIDYNTNTRLHDPMAVAFNNLYKDQLASFIIYKDSKIEKICCFINIFSALWQAEPGGTLFYLKSFSMHVRKIFTPEDIGLQHSRVFGNISASARVMQACLSREV